MSARSPIIAFGLQASTTALKAKAGCLTPQDQLSLVRSMFDWVESDTHARDAVRNFLNDVRVDSYRAGAILQDWLGSWQPALAPKRAEEILEVIDDEASDWQTRKDCGLD